MKPKRLIYAIRRKPDGTITRKTFSPKAWAMLGPLTISDPMGGRKDIPKQGYEQVPEGWNEPAPEPLNSKSSGDVSDEKPKDAVKPATQQANKPANQTGKPQPVKGQGK